MLALMLALFSAGVVSVVTSDESHFNIVIVILFLSMLFFSLVFTLAARRMVNVYTKSSASKVRWARSVVRTIQHAVAATRGLTLEASAENGTSTESSKGVSYLNRANQVAASLDEESSPLRKTDHAAAASRASHSKGTVNAIGNAVKGETSEPASEPIEASHAAISPDISDPRAKGAISPDISDPRAKGGIIGNAVIELKLAKRMKEKAKLFVTAAQSSLATIIFMFVLLPIWLSVSRLKLSAQLEWVLAFFLLSGFNVWTGRFVWLQWKLIRIDSSLS